jgi:hypothetical protein
MLNKLHRTHLVGILFLVGLTLAFVFIFPLTSSSGDILVPQTSGERCPDTTPRDAKYDQSFHLYKGESEDFNQAKSDFERDAVPNDEDTTRCLVKVRYSLYL